jgi:hypothetical protein
VTMTAWLLSIVELPRPLVPGDKIADAHGQMAHVYEVKKLDTRSTPIIGRPRPLYAVLHAGAGSVLVAVCLDDDGSDAAQPEWCCEKPKEKR